MKTEPTLKTNFLVNAGKYVVAGIGLGVKTTDHESLVTDALDAFTKAEQKMEGAIAQIDADIDAKEKEVAQIQENIVQAGESKGKLTRVLDRIKAFTA